MKDVLNVLQIVLAAALVGLSFAKFDRKLRLFAGGVIFSLLAIANAFEAGSVGEKDILPFVFLLGSFSAGTLCFLKAASDG